MNRLVSERIPLTVCPLSNTALRNVDNLKAHPLKKLIDAGLLVTVNSDDPAYFGGYVNENYVQTAEALNLTLKEVALLAKNSFSASWLSEDEKRIRIAEIQDILERY